MKRSVISLAGAFLCTAGASQAAPTLTTLANIPFKLDGANPQSGLTKVKGMRYGVTLAGGAHQDGTVYRINPETGAETLLYSFGATPTDAITPASPLVNVGGMLYGISTVGGANNNGTIYSVDPASGAESVAFSFNLPITGAPSNGGVSRLYYSNGLLYGTTCGGGPTHQGVLYSFDPTTNTQTVLYNFTSTSGNTYCPQGQVAIIDNVAYGTGINFTNGETNAVLYAVDLSSGTESVVATFGGNMGGYVSGGPVAVGNLLYFALPASGSLDRGQLYSFDPATNTLTDLHDFGSNLDCATPLGDLSVNKRVIYGGGAACGVWAYNIAAASESALPLPPGPSGPETGGPALGPFTFIGQSLYGTWGVQGINNEPPVPGATGYVYALNTATNAFTPLHQFVLPGVTPSSRNYSSALVQVGRDYYGVASEGGAYNRGVLYAVNGVGRLTVLHNFTGGADGGNPHAGLLDVSGTLYGTTQLGGASLSGSIFAFDPTTGTFTTLYSFAGATADGSQPEAALIKLGGLLYGTTSGGGSSGNGTLFSFEPLTNTETVLYTFTGVNSSVPLADLAVLNGTLYGTASAYNGCSNCYGSIFSYNPTTAAFTTLYNFPGLGNGANPFAGLTPVNGLLYGTTPSDIFQFNPATNVLTTLYKAFKGKKPAGITSDLLLVGTTLYGTSQDVASASLNDDGTIFDLSTTTGTEKTLYLFPGGGANGSYPSSALIQKGNGFLGTTSSGASPAGTVFKFRPSGPSGAAK